jgi:signal transduction histidine kinase
VSSGRPPIFLSARRDSRIPSRADLGSARGGMRVLGRRAYRLGVSRRWRRWALAAEVLPAAAVTAVTALAVIVSGPANPVLRSAGVLASLGLVVLVERRRCPLVTLAVVIVVFLVVGLAAPGAPVAAAFVAIMVCAYSLGSSASPGPLVAGLALASAFVAFGQYIAPSQGYSHLAADLFLVPVFVLAPAALGGGIRARARLAARLHTATDRLRAGHDARLEAAVTAERERVAAQLDRAALRGLDQARAHAAVENLADVVQIEQISRALLAELRRLVKELRDGGSGEQTGPAPALSQLRAQVERALTAGAAAQSRPGPSRWTLPSSRAVDAGLAVTAAALAVALGVTQYMSGHPPPQVLLAAGIALPVATARRFPLASATAAVLLTLAYTRLAAPANPQAGLPPTVIWVIMPLTIAAASPARRAAAGLALCLAGCLALAAASPGVAFAPAATAGSAVLTAGCWMAGRLLRSSADLIAANAAAATQVAGEQAQQEHQALAAERTRLARDLHDAIGHVMTVLVMQAAAARKVWQTDPARAAEHVTVLRSTLAGALDELHPLILALALDSTCAAGDGGLRELIDRARNCGLEVYLHRDGDTAAESTAARQIIQEALTNAARHAPGVPVRVHLNQDGEMTRVEITNGPSPLPPLIRHQGGAGIRGMTERAAAIGGTLTAAPAADGGFTVTALLPTGATR